MGTIAVLQRLRLYAGVGAAVALYAPLAAAEPIDADHASESVIPPLFDFSTPLPAPKPADGIGASKFTRSPLPSGWEAKVGLDPQTSWGASNAVRPDLPPVSANDTAWVNVTVPELAAPWSWDKASLETRIDPEQAGKLGLQFSRSLLPAGDRLSLTWQSTYSLTQSLSHEVTAGGTISVAGPTAVPTSARVFDTNQAMRFTLLPADTTFSVGATLSTVDEKWRPALSAEQKLFGGPVSLTGTLSEGAGGDISKSLKAGFKQTW